MNETDKLIEEQLKTLPPNLQQAIGAVPWKALVQEIGKANALDTEQIVSLERETMLVIYGFENPDDYVLNIVREVGVSEEVAYTITGSVADKIFEPILKKSEESEKPATSMTAPVSVPATPPANLPMVEKGEVVHDARPLTPEPARQSPDGSSRMADGRSDGGQVPHIEQPVVPPAVSPAPATPITTTPPEVKPEQPKVSLPDYRYEGGQDPYREPLG